MSTNKRKPSSIPTVPTDASGPMRQFLLAMKERVELRDGERGDPLEGFVRKGDLVDGGLAKVRKRGGAGGSGGTEVEIIGGGGWTPDKAAMPVRPRNFEGVGRFGEIALFWTTAHQLYAGHGLTEIWRAQGGDASRDSAILVDSITGNSFVDPISDPREATFTYWIRFVNTDGVPGPFSDPINVTKPEDLDLLFQRMEGEINETWLSGALRKRMDDVDEDLDVLAEGINTVSSEVGQVQQRMVTARRKDGTPITAAMFTMENSGEVSGFGLSSEGPGKATFGVNADNFYVGRGGVKGYPFFVQGDRVFMDTAFIRNASISNAMIGSLTASKVTAGDFGAQRITGSNLHITGNSTFEGTLNVQSGPGHQRMEMKNTGIRMFQNNRQHMTIDQNGITVYDSAGRVRVRLGRLL